MNYRSIRRKFSHVHRQNILDDNQIVYLLKTADRFGDLMPSMLDTPISHKARKAGLITNYKKKMKRWQGNNCFIEKWFWQKLTKKGRKLSKSLT